MKLDRRYIINKVIHHVIQQRLSFCCFATDNSSSAGRATIGLWMVGAAAVEKNEEEEEKN